MKTIIMAAIALAATPAAQAQTITGPSAPMKTIKAPIRAGTLVALRALTTTTALQSGSVVAFELAEPVVVDGKVVIPAGETATAEVSSVVKTSPTGPSRLTGRLRNLQYGNTSIRLIGGFEGTGSSLPTVPSGLKVNGYIDEDVPAYVAPPPVRPVPRTVVVADGASTATSAIVVRDTTIVRDTVVRDRVAAVPVTTRATRVTTAAQAPMYGSMRPTKAIAPKVSTARSKVTVREVVHQDHGTTTHYTY